MSQDQKPGLEGPRFKIQKQITKDQGPRTMSQKPKSKNPRNQDSKRLSFKIQKTRTRDSRNKDQE